MYPARVSRAFIIVLNVGFWFLGSAAFGAGVWIKFKKEQFVEILASIPYQGETLKAAVTETSLLDKSAMTLIFLGAFVFAVGASGMYGAYQQSRKLLFIYVSIVSAILLLEIAALITSIYFKSTVQTRLKVFLQSTIDNSYTGAGIQADGSINKNADPISAAWDFCMGHLECCGNTNYTDFMENAVNWNSTYTVDGAVVNATVPPMCCKMVDHSKFPGHMAEIKFVDLRGCLEHPREVNTNLEPCYDKVYAVLLQYIKIALIVVAAIILIEVVAIVASIDRETTAIMAAIFPF
ncbi:hypothetical protein LSAT2_011471 [Lamellibrachia satsuma]|nr:hypothetical protein LSAT2_011471 [Lamellibrachia satsuma]